MYIALNGGRTAIKEKEWIRPRDLKVSNDGINLTPALYVENVGFILRLSTCVL
jgi:hypothetical protein